MAPPPSEALRPLSNFAQLTLPLLSSDVGSVADNLRAAGIQPRVDSYKHPSGDATLVAHAPCELTRCVAGSSLRFSRGPLESTVCGAKVLEVPLPRQVQGADGTPVIVSGCIIRCSDCDRRRVKP